MRLLSESITILGVWPIVTKPSNDKIKLFNFVDGAYYINLDHRKDKRLEFEAHLTRLDIINYVSRVSGVYPTELFLAKKDVPEKEKIKFCGNELGTVCCWVTHYLIIKEAKRLGLKNVLVFEDDAEFHNHNEYAVDVICHALHQLQYIPSWEIVYLGGDPTPDIDAHPSGFNLVAPNLIEVQNIWGTHAVLYNSTIFDKFICDVESFNTETNSALPPDIYLNGAYHRKYLVYPLAVSQRAKLKSDILGKVAYDSQDWLKDKYYGAFNGKLAIKYKLITYDKQTN